MTLEDDLKARTLALISQQMANWVVEIQNHIRQHQANLVATLDELQESVARYDERINEGDVGTAMSEVVASQPPAVPPAPAGPGLDRVRRSLAEIDKGTSLSEVLTTLVNEVAQYAERAAMFIVKGSNAIGWYARGFDHPELVKQLTLPLNSDTVFRIVHNAHHALRGHISHSPGTAQVLVRLGGNPQGILAVPLILRDKLAAILYCDTQQEELPEGDAHAIEMLVLFAGKSIDLISLTPKAAAPPVTAAPPAAQPPPAARTTTAGIEADRSAALRAAVEQAKAASRAPAPASIPPAAPGMIGGGGTGEGSSTVMFNASQFAALRQQQAPAPPARPAPPPPAPPPQPLGLSPEEHKAHEDAKRFARLVVSEIKLYNESKVNDGRRHRDLYERLKEDIERGRQMYSDRVPPHIREHTNYFVDELVRILAGGDATALGPM